MFIFSMNLLSCSPEFHRDQSCQGHQQCYIESQLFCWNLHLQYSKIHPPKIPGRPLQLCKLQKYTKYFEIKKETLIPCGRSIFTYTNSFPYFDKRLFFIINNKLLFTFVHFSTNFPVLISILSRCANYFTYFNFMSYLQFLI